VVSRYLVSRLKFEPNTSQVWSKNQWACFVRKCLLYSRILTNYTIDLVRE
jgi:hypothetical protein